MKKFAAVALAGMLAGCAGTQTLVSSVVATAVSDIEQACKLVPDQAAISAIVALNDPLLSTGAEIAQAFCNAVKTSTPAAARAKATAGGAVSGAVVIDGVTVKYHN